MGINGKTSASLDDEVSIEGMIEVSFASKVYNKKKAYCQSLGAYCQKEPVNE
jgi:hypothetical protein